MNLNFLSFNYYFENSSEQWRRNLYYYYWGIIPSKVDFNFFKNTINLPVIVFKQYPLNRNNIDSSGYRKVEQIDSFWVNQDRLKNMNKYYKELWDKGIGNNKNRILLENLIKRTQEKNIKLVFFIAPVTKESIKSLDSRIMQSFEKDLNYFMSTYNINTFNKSGDTSFTNKYYRDFDHLNYKGAKKFSKMLSKFIELNINSE